LEASSRFSVDIQSIAVDLESTYPGTISTENRRQIWVHYLLKSYGRHDVELTSDRRRFEVDMV